MDIPAVPDEVDMEVVAIHPGAGVLHPMAGALHPMAEVLLPGETRHHVLPDRRILQSRPKTGRLFITL